MRVFPPLFVASPLCAANVARTSDYSRSGTLKWSSERDRIARDGIEFRGRYMFAQAERITAGDRLASVGHNCAKKRLAFLLVDILHRLRSADRSVTSSFHMHLTRRPGSPT